MTQIDHSEVHIVDSTLTAVCLEPDLRRCARVTRPRRMSHPPEHAHGDRSDQQNEHEDADR